MAARQPIPSSQTTTTKTTFRAPPPGSPLGSDAAKVAGLLGGVAALYYLAKSRTASAAPTTAPATTSSPTSTATASTVSPPLGVPGAPSILTQVGGTATSVILTTNQVQGATQYNAYEQNTNLLLATSPTNVLTISGLQTNSGYEVYVRAQNSAGQLSPPSQPLLVKTGAGSPVVYITQTAPSTSPSVVPVPSEPVIPTGQALTLTANPAQPAVGDAVTLTAASSALNTYLSQTGAAVVTWQWVVKAPSGAVAVNRTDTSAASADTISLAPNSAGTWAVTVTASVGGATVGTGTLSVPVIQPTQAAPSTPLTTQNTQNVVTTNPSNQTVIPTGASPGQRLNTLQTAAIGTVVMPGLTAAQVTLLQQLVRQYSGATTGVLSNGVIGLNPSSNQAVGLLRATAAQPGGPGHSFPGISIADQSAPYVAYLGLLALQGKLQGLTASGQAIT